MACAVTESDESSGRAPPTDVPAPHAEISDGVPEDVIGVDSRGSRVPVTGDYCDARGDRKKGNQAMVDCLQLDRRVEIEVEGLPKTRTASTGR